MDSQREPAHEVAARSFQLEPYQVRTSNAALSLCQLREVPPDPCETVLNPIGPLGLGTRHLMDYREHLPLRATA